MTEKIICLLQILINEEKIGLQQKGPFSHTGQKSRCLSTTRGLSVHAPVCVCVCLHATGRPSPTKSCTLLTELLEKPFGRG